jgi:pyruvate/2-oxoacid:ferredoxin oxidoreductase alpha subunit
MAVKLLNPLPEATILRFVDRARTVLVPEANYGGQFAHLLRATLGRETQSVARFDGLPFTSGDMLARIREASHAR